MPDTKYFDGKKYTYHSEYYVKTEADETAEILRKTAISVRVARGRDYVGHKCYEVYWRK